MSAYVPMKNQRDEILLRFSLSLIDKHHMLNMNSAIDSVR